LALKRALRQTLSGADLRHSIRRIYPRRSQSEPLLQVADMTAGAIYRQFAAGDSRFYEIVQSCAIVWRI